MKTLFNALVRIVVFGFIATLGLMAATHFYGASVEEFSALFLAFFTVKLAWSVDDQLAEVGKRKG